MADRVRYILDRMAITFKQMEQTKLFSQDEVKAIVKKRTDFEYTLRRTELTVDNVREYIQYETTLDKLLEIRSKKLLQETNESKVSSIVRTLRTQSIRHIHYIYERALRRFADCVELWDEAISFLERKQSNSMLDELLGRAIALHPKTRHFWIKAAEHELSANNNLHAARILIQRSLRVNEGDATLWAAYFRMEIWNAERALERQQSLGISAEALAETVRSVLAPALVVFRYARDALDYVHNSSHFEALLGMHLLTLPEAFATLGKQIEDDLVDCVNKTSSTSLQQTLSVHLLNYHVHRVVSKLGAELVTLEDVMRSLVPQSLSVLSTVLRLESNEGTVAAIDRLLSLILRSILSSANPSTSGKEKNAPSSLSESLCKIILSADNEEDTDLEDWEAVVPRTRQLMEQKSAEHKKRKKEVQQQFISLLDRLFPSAHAVESDAQASALLRWIDAAVLTQLIHDRAVQDRVQSIFQAVHRHRLTTDRLPQLLTLVQRFQRLDQLSAASEATELRASILDQVQSWASLTLHAMQVTETSLEKYSALTTEKVDRSLITTQLPLLSPWLLQSATAADKVSTVGEDLLEILTSSLEEYRAVVSHAVCDSRVTSLELRNALLLHLLSHALPTRDEWITLTDEASLVTYFEQMRETVQWVQETRRRQPHFFAKTNWSSFFHVVLRSVDRFHQVLENQGLTTGQKRARDNATGGLQSKLHRFLAETLTQATDLAPSEETFYDRQIALLRQTGKHEEANHLQFKRRRLLSQD